MSSYDSWKTNDYDKQQDLDEADHRLQELNNQLAELEDELAEAQETDDDEHCALMEIEISQVRGEITDLKRKLGITEF